MSSLPEAVIFNTKLVQDSKDLKKGVYLPKQFLERINVTSPLKITVGGGLVTIRDGAGNEKWKSNKCGENNDADEGDCIDLVEAVIRLDDR